MLGGRARRQEHEHLESGANYPLKRLPDSTEWERFAKGVQDGLNAAGEGLYVVSDVAFTNEDNQPALTFHCQIDVTGREQKVKDTIMIVLHHEWTKVIQGVM